MTEPHDIDRPLIERFPDLLPRFFASAPFELLRKGLLKRFIYHGLQPEIGLEGTCLYDCSRQEFTAVAQALRQAKLSCSMHAPFADLGPAPPTRKFSGSAGPNWKKFWT